MKAKLLRKIRKTRKIMIDIDNNYYYVLRSSGWFSEVLTLDKHAQLADAIDRQHISIRGELKRIKLKKLIEISPKNKLR